MENLHNHRGITNSNSCPPRGFTDIFRRELGLSHPNSFARRFSASEVLPISLSISFFIFVSHFISLITLRDHPTSHINPSSSQGPSSGNNKQTLSKVGLNSIVIDCRNPYYFAIGGSDEYARVYDIRKCQWGSARNSDRPVNTFCPCHLIGSNNVHITGLAYSSFGELLVSYNDELIYLFEKNMHSDSSPSSATSEDPKNIHEAQVYSGHRNAQTIKGVNFFGPNDEYVLSGSDCGHIFIWKKKEAKLVRLMVGDQHVVNQLEAHPHIPILATCGIEKNVKI